MADYITRYWPIYVAAGSGGLKKIAVAHEQVYDVNGNKSLLFAAEGAVGVAIGATHTQIQIQSIDPVGGADIDFIALVLQSGMFTAGVPQTDGTVKLQRMAASNVQKKTNSETGRSDISCTFIGLAPKQT